MSEIFKEIEKTIKENKIVLFMKGNKAFPQCGFSSFVVKVLQNMEVEFHDVDILKDENLRQGIKDYSNWPTIPQLYVKGEFIGGCDIVKEMFEAGELQEIFHV
jgi:monothiol glutaredoxin